MSPLLIAVIAMPATAANDGSLRSQLLWQRHSTSCALGSDEAEERPDVFILLSMICLAFNWHGAGRREVTRGGGRGGPGGPRPEAGMGPQQGPGPPWPGRCCSTWPAACGGSCWRPTMALSCQVSKAYQTLTASQTLTACQASTACQTSTACQVSTVGPEALAGKGAALSRPSRRPSLQRAPPWGPRRGPQSSRAVACWRVCARRWVGMVVRRMCVRKVWKDRPTVTCHVIARVSLACAWQGRAPHASRPCACTPVGFV